MNKDVRYWYNISKYDIETAQAMFKACRYLYVLFTCQQALEKIIKAFVTLETKKLPPKLHNLLRLAELANLNFDEEEKKFLEKLNYYYLETRYPEYKEKVAAELSKEIAKKYLVKTKEIWNCLEKKLP
ncbi:MAG: HEPN domain-containing protein [Candidatus Saganbacteria bacterium]|uniref:HEPN domain-containing protein n=1 Tax=Candidatus Saganbacteria bacterium TaxID=2575572 RepID=A0A833L1K9_UNCSA|nr:MAG: HEPN domain-containing protein [Candidatus Saganbacteria bacterium]